MKQIPYSIYLILTYIFLVACNETPDHTFEINRPAVIYPEYTETYIPYNIAPLNFEIRDKAEKYIISIEGENSSFRIATRKTVNIPGKKWRKLLEDNKGNTCTIRIWGYQDKKWIKFNDLVLSIAPEPIDPYVAYRLIDPGYVLWNKVGIYQRCLETFDETPILVNSLTGKSCMNCHSFCNNDPDKMLFHLRASFAGTMIIQNGQVEKVSTKLPSTVSEGVYPRWHPEGRYVAFSVNNTAQTFHASHPNKIEVYDDKSDIILYDTQTYTVFTDENIYTENRFETFPEWSPDGRYLYFCSAEAREMPEEYEELRYDLLRIPFNPASGKFENRVDTLISSHTTGKSVAHPRISPDGKQLVFCMFDYGTFPIWHHENDLYSLDLNSGEITCLDIINSPKSDSYHSWSSNGRWFIFGSRRIDGLHTRLYISYVDEAGNFYPPFLLPQKDPEYYDFFLKSYNIPEFITGKVKVSPQTLNKAARKKAIPAKSGF